MFDRFFNQNTPIWGAMSKIFDLFFLNLYLLVCCIPIFTIGPALTGFFYVLIEMARNEENDITKSYFRSFRRNFKQGIQLGLPLTLLIIFLIVDIMMSYSQGTGIWTFFMFFFAVILIFVIFTSLYIFPILAKFEKKNREILIWSFTLSLKHIGRTLCMILVILVSAVLVRRIPGLLFIIFGLDGLFIASQMVKILNPWLPEVIRPGEDIPSYNAETAAVQADVVHGVFRKSEVLTDHAEGPAQTASGNETTAPADREDRQ